jgi:hypothetical protein
MGSGKEDEVRRRLGSWARPLAGLLSLAVALVGFAPAATAAEATPQAAQPKTLTVSANATVAAMALPTAALAQAAQATPAGTTDTGKGFFKTGAGKVALVLMLAGTGYMVYSAFKDNDPVHSQFR